jgi:hypothetical protein
VPGSSRGRGALEPMTHSYPQSRFATDRVLLRNVLKRCIVPTSISSFGSQPSDMRVTSRRPRVTAIHGHCPPVSYVIGPTLSTSDATSYGGKGSSYVEGHLRGETRAPHCTRGFRPAIGLIRHPGIRELSSQSAVSYPPHPDSVCIGKRLGAIMSAASSGGWCSLRLAQSPVSLLHH